MNHPIKNSLIRIFITMACAVTLVVSLAWYSDYRSPKLNGFTRHFPGTTPLLTHTLSSRYTITAVAGFTATSIYFQTLNPALILRANHQLGDTSYIFLPVDSFYRTATNFEYQIDSPNIYLFARNVPAIYKWDLVSKKKISQSYTSRIFTRSLVLEPNRFFLRGFDSSIKIPGQIFLKGSFQQGVTYRESKLIPPHKDLGMPTDGILLRDQNTDRLVYVFFYKNSYLVLDTNFNLSGQGETIDPVDSALLKVGGGIKEGKTFGYTNTSPKRIVNIESCISDGILYNNSLIKADNESNHTFASNNAIDMYDLKTYLYRGSLDIPLLNEAKISRFKVFQHDLVAIFTDGTAGIFKIGE